MVQSSFVEDGCLYYYSWVLVRKNRHRDTFPLTGTLVVTHHEKDSSPTSKNKTGEICNENDCWIEPTEPIKDTPYHIQRESKKRKQEDKDDDLERRNHYCGCTATCRLFTHYIEWKRQQRSSLSSKDHSCREDDDNDGPFLWRKSFVFPHGCLSRQSSPTS